MSGTLPPPNIPAGEPSRMPGWLEFFKRLISRKPSYEEVHLVSAGIVYYGDADTNGSWRIGISGSDFVHQKREAGSWVTTGPAPGPHSHDTDTLQLDGINSNGGAFAFTTSGDVTFNNDLVIAGNIVTLKASGNGIKVDNTTPTFGWRDLRAEIRTRGVGATDPNDATYIGNVKAYSFSVNDEAWIEYHLPHDYVKGTDIHLHFHWSHNSADVTGGSITLGADVTYAKGHDQAAFAATVNPTLSPNASTIRYRHMLSEIQLSASSPSATQIDTDDLEPDGLILARVYLSANNITSSNGVPDPFIHEVDIHYQSTNIATKDKVPDFYA